MRAKRKLSLSRVANLAKGLPHLLGSVKRKKCDVGHEYELKFIYSAPSHLKHSEGFRHSAKYAKALGYPKPGTNWGIT